MRVAQIHNAYQIAGGEDRVVELERALLESRGDAVETFRVTNDTITGLSGRLATLMSAPYNKTARKQLRSWFEGKDLDVVHVHNFFPLLSPSIYDACADAGLPVVQTLHNFRTFCAGAFMLRNGRYCDKCLGGNRAWGIVHRCYRGSLPGSLATAGMIREYHRDPLRVHRYVALNAFARRVFVTSGLPAERIVVKPNFVADPGPPPAPSGRTGGLFVGRLSIDKGVLELVRAWRDVGKPLKIAGTGPLDEAIRTGASPEVSVLGWLSGDEVRRAMQEAEFLVAPSLSTEQFPMALVEAFSCGLPVITSRSEALAEIVADGQTGLLCTPGDINELQSKIRWAATHPDDMLRMGRAARMRYETLYSEDVNYAMLTSIYAQAIASAQGSAASGRDRSPPPIAEH